MVAVALALAAKMKTSAEAKKETSAEVPTNKKITEVAKIVTSEDQTETSGAANKGITEAAT